MQDFLVGLGIALLIEGGLLALLPEAMKRRVATILEQPSHLLRAAGVGMAALGVGLVWLVRSA
ncbi:MAG: DUF2065 domain-containing protein [Alphaproteobacteria bacterium]|nr:DUF2065 domain-containing protein [Alphaproteobacteria bacterium]